MFDFFHICSFFFCIKLYNKDNLDLSRINFNIHKSYTYVTYTYEHVSHIFHIFPNVLLFNYFIFFAVAMLDALIPLLMLLIIYYIILLFYIILLYFFIYYLWKLQKFVNIILQKFDLFKSFLPFLPIYFIWQSYNIFGKFYCIP